MPIYEYVCEGCGHRFEVLLARSGEACPGCGGQQVRKLPSALAVTHGESLAAPRGCDSGGCSCCG